MKKDWVSSWKASVQPRKQRKYRAQAPLHIKKKYLSAPLAKELRQKHGTRSLGLRVGDKVKVLRGEFRGKTGKVETVSSKTGRITIAGITLTKKDGSKAVKELQPSNVQIIEIKMDDKQRSAILERRK